MAEAVSDNGNSFVSNLYKDILKTFHIKVKFTPAYHAATNGAIERCHQTFKNGLKAALIDMGDEHRENWYTALPWILLGKRVQYQPHLDTSAAQLVMGKSPKIPGMLLGQPGPPLNTSQTRALLEQLYRQADRPAIQMSGRGSEINIDHTLNATHVYVKKDNPLSLCQKFEGPYEIIQRPSRSTIVVKIGSKKDGSPRLLTFNWASCKVAHMRDGAEVGERPKLGRPSKSPEQSPEPIAADDLSTNSSLTDKRHNAQNKNKPKSAKIQTPDHDTISEKAPHPDYIRRGPLITEKMFDDANWPEILNIPPSKNTKYPTRSTRNKNPQYT